MSIGNVHLCGGGPDETSITKSSYTMEDLENIKIETLEKLVGYDVDIILGDFNSDAMVIRSPGTTSNENYLLSKGGIWNRSTIYEWNMSPYLFLQDNYYNRVPNWKTTSYFGGCPDNIFYRPGINLENHGILDLILPENMGYHQYAEATDHNGIYASFSTDPLQDSSVSDSFDSTSESLTDINSDDCSKDEPV